MCAASTASGRLSAMRRNSFAVMSLPLEGEMRWYAQAGIVASECHGRHDVAISARELHAWSLLGLSHYPLTRAAAPELHLRYDESERRPSARHHGALEPAAGFGRITAHQVPVANSIAQRRHLDVTRIGGREHGIGRDFAAIQAQPLCVGVARVRRVGVTIEQRLRISRAAGA